ncbi:hypothetical protein C6376_24295 [Streptomyces sp. P3]|nr:hypothetical protein C6376_24295 [Streptomyces sp. P3]
MTDHRGGPDACGPPLCGEGDLDGPQGRLDDVHAIKVGLVRFTAQHGEQVPVDEGPQSLTALLQTLRERTVVVEEFDGHGGPLGALTGKDESGIAQSATGAAHHVGVVVRIRVSQCAQACHQLCAVVSGDCGSVFEHGP